MDTTPYKMSQTPAFMHSQLDSIQFDTAGGMYIGASGLTGRLWKGSVWYFSDASKAPDASQCVAGADLDAGTADLQLLTNDKIVLATDAGTIEVWELSGNKETFVQVFKEIGHDDIVSSVSVSSNQSTVASAGYDCRIRIWDIAEGIATHSFRGHYSIVNNVVFHPSQPDIFASCSQDGSVLVWDLRKPNPATKIDVSSVGSVPTCVAWQPGQDMALAIGTESGHIAIKNCASEVLKVASCQTHAAPVYKIFFHPQNSSWIASTSNDCSVAVTNIEEDAKSVLYKDSRHKDFSRGLAWSPLSNTVFSCGWDTQVLSHSILPSSHSNGHMSEDCDNTAS